MIPYRAKNPPESFPYVTIVLLVVNTLVFALTSQLFLVIREDVTEQWAVSHNTLNPIRLVTAMFLHGSLLHLLGNMLALWIFGAAAEGRLKTGKFLLVYFASGIAGGLLHDGVVGILNPDQFGLGASGAIMGLAGAYLYMFPFARIRVWLGWGWMRWISNSGPVADWHAQWVVLQYVAFDVLEGVLWRSVGTSGGVAHFAHLGGFGAGFLATLALRARRDSEEASDAQAVRADAGGDFRALSLPDLEALVEREPENAALVLTFCQKALLNPIGGSSGLARRMFVERVDLLLAQPDLDAVGRLALTLSAETGSVASPTLMRIAGRLESRGEYAFAEQLYRRVLQQDSDGPDTELALIRLARLMEQTEADKGRAAAVYAELVKRYPLSAHVPYAQAALARLPAPSGALSIGTGGSVTVDAPQAPPPGFGAVGQNPRPTPPRPKADDEGGSAESHGLRPLGG